MQGTGIYLLYGAFVMKVSIIAIALTVVVDVSAVSFVQSNQPVTRAQVRAELIQF